MTMLEILKLMDRGKELVRRYDQNGNFWVIVGEKCSGLVNRLIKRRYIRVVNDTAHLTNHGRARLGEERDT